STARNILPQPTVDEFVPVFCTQRICVESSTRTLAGPRFVSEAVSAKHIEKCVRNEWERAVGQLLYSIVDDVIGQSPVLVRATCAGIRRNDVRIEHVEQPRGISTSEASSSSNNRRHLSA